MPAHTQACFHCRYARHSMPARWIDATPGRNSPAYGMARDVHVAARISARLYHTHNTILVPFRWTEHDPMEIWDSVVACIAAVMAAAGDVEVRAP